MSKRDGILARLSAKRSGKGWTARCPAHKDRAPSLSIGVGSNGETLIHCHAGCSVESVLAAIGQNFADLFEGQGTPSVRANSERTFATVEAAVQSVRAPWRHARTFCYESAEGSALLYVVRYQDENGGKTFRPISRSSAGWILKDPPGPLPLYRLPELRDAVQVLVVEGEGCAEVARELGLVATTSPHGAKSAGRANWSVLKGKRVAILPDNDEAGRGYAQSVAGILLGLDPPARVCIVELPDLGQGEDIADFVRARRAAGKSQEAIRAEILALVECTPPREAEDAEAGGVDFEPMPLDVFSPELRAFVEYGSASTCSDPSFIAVPALAVLAGAIGNAAEVELREGWQEPCILWTAIIGASSSRKSPALRLVKDPLKRLQVRVQREHERALFEYRRDMAEHEARARKARGDARAADAEPPRAPVLRRYFVSDVTIEALASILVAQKRGTVVIRDELSGWVRSFNQYKARGGDDEARWLELWSADSLSVERRTGDERSLFVERPAVSLTGSIQPGVLAEVFTRIRRESGLLARISFAYPPPVRARWQRSTGGGQSVGCFARMVERLASLPMETGSDGSPRPMRLGLGEGAEKLWGPFYEETQGRALELGEDGGPTWAKLAGVCARIALVLELAKWASEETPGPLPSDVSPETMGGAIRLALWFGREALRVHALLDRSGKDRELDGFEERIARRGGSVSVRDWQRMRSKGRASEARAELQGLVDDGRARWEAKGGSKLSLLVLIGRRRAPGAPRTAPPSPEAALSEVSVSDLSEADPHAAEERAAIREADSLPQEPESDKPEDPDGAPETSTAQDGLLFVDSERKPWEDH